MKGKKSAEQITIEKYQRGRDTEAYFKKEKDKKLQSNLRKAAKAAKHAAVSAAKTEVLLTEEAGYLEAEGEMEKTYKFSQEQIKENVDLQSANKIFNLNLDTFGPYTFDYTRSGRHVLLGGRKGHVAMMDWVTKKLYTELHLNETVRDVKFCNNDQRFLVAQLKYVYMYDKKGKELHVMKKHVDVTRLEFLPYHFLMVSVGNAGHIKWQDITTGELIADWRTGLGPCSVMRQNPRNAVVHLGHHNGVVTMWSPNQNKPLVRMLTHRGPVTAVSFDASGGHMVTTGVDGCMKIWDLRNYKALHEYHCVPPAAVLNVSQRGMVAVGAGSRVMVWKDMFGSAKQSDAYMVHNMPGLVASDVHFCPFEDVLGIGHSGGFSSILVPGSGEPNVDTFEANPYETKKQKQESEVHQLLEKLRPEMIALNPDFIGGIVRTPVEVRNKALQLAQAANPKKKKERKAARGGSKASRKLKKKNANIWDEKKAKIAESRQKSKEKRKKLIAEKRGLAGDVLARFKRKAD